MKKQIIGLIALLVVFTLMAACSPRPAPPPQEPADVNEVAPVSESSAAEQPAEAAVEGQPAEAQPAEAPAEAAAEGQPAQAPAEAAVEGQAAEAAPAEAPAEPQAVQSNEVDPVAAAPAAQPRETPGKYGLIAGDINDRGFNQLAWEGMQRAAQEFGIEVVYSQTFDGVEFSQNINDVLKAGVDGVITLGFDFAPAVRAASEANPSIPFLSIDFPSQTANDLGILFASDEPSFLAGYLAAGMTQTGTVCTYGGEQTPPVLSFMVGFEGGVKYFNNQNGTNVQLLGWRTDANIPAGGEGRFIDTFSDEAVGRQVAEEFFGQGCDVIFPVAGGAGVGSAAAAQEQGLKVIGVDADQTQTDPEYAEVFLTSVLKKIDAVVYEAIRMNETGEMLDDSQTYRNNFIGTLANGGVGLAPFYSNDSQIPQPLKDSLTQIEARLVEGSLPTGWPISRAPAMAAVAAPPTAVPAPAPAPAQAAPAPAEEAPAPAQAAPAPEETPAPTQSSSTGSSSSSLTLETLRNAEYQVEYTADGTAKLANGEYSEPAAPGSASKVVVKMSDFVALGDLTGDGVDDAAVILVSSGGGSGTFYDLVVMVDENGVPTQAAGTLLGDRIQIKSLTIEDGQVVINMVTQGPNDPMFNPTQNVTKRYELQAQLVEVEAGDDNTAGDAAQPEGFAGTYTAQLPAASSPGRQITLVLNSDNSVELSTDFQNGKPPIVEVGTWQDNGDGTVTVSLTGRDDGTTFNQPDVVTFGLSGSELKAIAWDTNVYGTEGLTLTKQ